jgi:ATP-dependent RNA helicase DeaD
MKFKDLNIKQGILRSLDEVWYVHATEIQEKTIPLALQWKNIVWQAQTWTGKTWAFLIPLLNNIDTNKKENQALILAPTRELAIQIHEEIYKFTKYYRVPSTVIYWWVKPTNQKIALKKIPRIIVATPGRFLELQESWLVDLKTIKTFVLDEVDRMLAMWFIRDIIKVRKQLKNLEQTYTFSATMNNKIKQVIDNHTSNYETIKVWKEITVEKIDHSYIFVEYYDKFINLTKIINTHKLIKIIIFANTRSTTNILFNTLSKEGYKVWVLNGWLLQSKRRSTLQWFINGKFRILITTDVAARGLNMENIWLVINFDIPKELENYVHRIWRTWRAGDTGKAILFVEKKEKSILTDLETQCWSPIPMSNYKPITDKNGIYKNLPSETKTQKRQSRTPKRQRKWQKPQNNKFQKLSNSKKKKKKKTIPSMKKR